MNRNLKAWLIAGIICTALFFLLGYNQNIEAYHPMMWAIMYS